jgi:hydrogenase/urease accessory protein HupE
VSRRSWLGLVLVLALLLWPSAARAHGTRSVSIDVTEVGHGQAVVHLWSSAPGDLSLVRAVFDAPCTTTAGEAADAAVTMVTCPGSLEGSRVTVVGLGPILSEAILVVSLQGGERLSRVLTTQEPSFVLPARESRLDVARSYVRLGMMHILTGYDHLLFLLALVLLLRRPRAVLVAETAFTLSHSLSFSATALGFLRVSAPAAEAAIALSLVLIALDIGRAPTSGVVVKKGPLDARERQGALMAFVFGLVHGLGFAGGLREIGLPELHVSFALLGFALGVEIGQVAFLVLALILLHVASKLFSALRVEAVTGWGYLFIGSVATYWLLERARVLLSPYV